MMMRQQQLRNRLKTVWCGWMMSTLAVGVNSVNPLVILSVMSWYDGKWSLYGRRIEFEYLSNRVLCVCIYVESVEGVGFLVRDIRICPKLCHHRPHRLTPPPHLLLILFVLLIRVCAWHFYSAWLFAGWRLVNPIHNERVQPAADRYIIQYTHWVALWFRAESMFGLFEIETGAGTTEKYGPPPCASVCLRQQWRHCQW